MVAVDELARVAGVLNRAASSQAPDICPLRALSAASAPTRRGRPRWTAAPCGSPGAWCRAALWEEAGPISVRVEKDHVCCFGDVCGWSGVFDDDCLGGEVEEVPVEVVLDMEGHLVTIWGEFSEGDQRPFWGMPFGVV